ncbi:MAG: extracellular solute-binding protein [Xanthobacteraceae bacterium]|nr:extracellular solute-binding protein [Xanthobacteraceae bacterium]
MIKSRQTTRRGLLQLGAGAAALPLVHVRGAGAAGRLAVAFWNHWVPGGDEILRKQIEAWAEKNKVDVRVDFITSNAMKLTLTAAAEAQSGQGHDALQFGQNQYDVFTYADQLEPVDDAIKAITDQWGPFIPNFEYLGKVDGHWRAIPTSTYTGSRPVLARISLLKQLADIDVQALYPPHKVAPPEGAEWTYDAFVRAGERCKRAGYGFGLGIGNTADSVGNASVWFASFGAELVDAKGNVVVGSDKMRGFLEWAKRLVAILPDDALSYDDASDNRLMIAGKTALIFDPPSPYAVAKRDNPKISADMWSLPCPAGPAGRFIPHGYAFSGIWRRSQNKSAAKDLLVHLSARDLFEERCRTVEGFDIPVLASMADSPIWDDVGPPRGVFFNYPVRPWHGSVGLPQGWPAPPAVAAQIVSRATMPNMLARLYRGQSVKEVVDWAAEELDGFSRG